MQTLFHKLTATLLLVALPGCAPEMFAPPAEAIISPPSKYVKTTGACLDLNTTQKSNLTREEFLGKVQEMQQSDRRIAAATFIRRHPDAALDLLRTTSCDEASKPAVLLVAKVYDEHCNPSQTHVTTQCSFNPSSTAPNKDIAATEDQAWLPTLRDRAERPERFRAFDQDCARLKELQRSGKHAEAAKIAASLKPPTRMLENEACRIRGEVFLQAERPAEAAKVFSAGLQDARGAYQILQFSLLLGEAQRRAGLKDEAGARWCENAQIAWNLTNANRSFGDPALWERIAAQRPAQIDWPQATPNCDQATLNEAWVFKQIGLWRLQRGEAQAALAALKRGETLASDQKSRDQCQLLQAQALIQLNQRAAALTTLARLAENPSADVTAPALAMLGAIKHFEGNKAQALALFEKAFELNPRGDWIMRAQAEADLGYLYLMRGDDAKGLQSLHRAQSRFELSHEDDQLVQCLTNEAAYLDQKGMNDQARQIRQRLKNLQDG